VPRPGERGAGQYSGARMRVLRGNATERGDGVSSSPSSLRVSRFLRNCEVGVREFG